MRNSLKFSTGHTEFYQSEMMGQAFLAYHALEKDHDTGELYVCIKIVYKCNLFECLSLIPVCLLLPSHTFTHQAGIVYWISMMFFFELIIIYHTIYNLIYLNSPAFKINNLNNT